MSAMAGDGGADLGAQALIRAEQRHIPVSRSRGDHLDHARVVEVAKAADDIAVERLEVIQRGGEETAPETGSLGKVPIARLDEVSLIFPGSDDLPSQVFRELGNEIWMGKLFQQDGGEADIEVRRNAIALQTAEDTEQGQVGFGGCFVQPLNAVGPSAVIDDVRQMRMQSESEKTCGGILCFCQTQPQSF
jgi:hypothetical protein